ncbi:unnamed protein product, partial [Allacma fusca]
MGSKIEITTEGDTDHPGNETLEVTVNAMPSPHRPSPSG